MSKRKSMIGLITALAVSMSVGAANAQAVEFGHDKANWADAIDEMIAASGADITQTPFSDTDQYKAFAQSGALAGDMPALLTWWTGGPLTELVESGAIADLDPLWDELVAAGNYEDGLRPMFQVDGVTYGIPLNLSRWIVLYNKAQFEAANVDVPQSWEELHAAADALKAAGHTPFHATVQGGWRGFIWFQEIMLRTNAEAYAGLFTGETAYDGPEVRKAFEIWSDWYAKGYFSDPRSTEEVADFARGAGAMYLIGDWQIGGVEGAGMEVGTDFGIFVMPNESAGSASTVIVEGAPIVVSAAAVNDPNVLAFLKYFASTEGSNAWAASAGITTGNLNANTPNTLIDEVSAFMSASGTSSATRWWEGTPGDYLGEANAEFNAFILDPTMERAEEAMATIQQLHSEYWAAQ